MFHRGYKQMTGICIHLLKNIFLYFQISKILFKAKVKYCLPCWNMKNVTSQDTERNIARKFMQGKASHMHMLITDKLCLTFFHKIFGKFKEKKSISVCVF